MGAPNLAMLYFFAKVFKVETFVETGTAYGETLERVLPLFPDIYTVELGKVLYEVAQTKYGNRVRCAFGDSPTFLESILPKLADRPVAYWLDAHYAGPPSAGEEKQCPLLEELLAINKREVHNDFIIIDDAHLFFSPAGLPPPLDPNQWPNITEIFKYLGSDRYVIIRASWKQLEGGPVMPEDTIVAVPAYAKPKMIDWLRDH